MRKFLIEYVWHSGETFGAMERGKTQVELNDDVDLTAWKKEFEEERQDGSYKSISFMEELISKDNYFSKEQNLKYMGHSQYLDFCECEAKALAKAKGEYQEEETDAFIIGKYVDAYYEGTLEDFKKNNPKLFKKDGTLQAKYEVAENGITTIENDPMLKKYATGQQQVVMTGTISGVPVKIMIDSYFPHKAIVDRKMVKDFMPVWDDRVKSKVSFVEKWGYDIQGAFYNEIVRQNTQEDLPFILEAVTKEKQPDKALLEIPQEECKERLEDIKKNINRFYEIKLGHIEPKRCGHCDYCKATKKITGIIDYHDLEAQYE